MPPKGITHTEEARAKISAAHKGTKHTPETRAKMSVTRTGKKRTPPSKETRAKLSAAIKGKKHSLETCAKISAFNMGRKHTVETRAKMCAASKSGLPETRAKISVAHKGKSPSLETRAKIGAKNKGRCHTLKVRTKMSISRLGEKNPSWKGGSSFFPYCGKFNEQRKRACRNFFGNRCIVCGKHSSENIVGGKINRQKALSVHHVDHDKDQGCSGKPFNLIPLCNSCHAVELHREEEYKKHINTALREGFKWGIWNEEEYIEKVMF